MDPETTDVNTSVESSTTETIVPSSPDAGLAKVVQDAFNKSTSSVEKKDEKATEEVEQEVETPEVETTTPETTPDKETPETKVETAKVEDKGPVPYERFAEVNKAKTTYEAQVAQMQPLVQAYESIANFCQESDISPDEYSYWMNIAALAKTNPQEAFKKLEPAITHMKSFVGEVLPKDLQTAVDTGEITLDWARKLAAAQAQQSFNAQRGQQLQQQAVTRQQQVFQQALVSGFDSWAKNKAATNPDFAPKSDPKAADGLYELVVHKLNVMARDAKISSVEDLVITAEEALKSVEASLGRYKVPVKPSVNVRTKTTVSAKPTQFNTLHDVISATAAKHGLVMAK